MTSFADLGVPCCPVLRSDGPGHHRPLPHPDRHAARLAGRPRRPRPRPHGLRQDPRVRPPARRARTAAAGKGKVARRPRALVLAPTRELATQIDATIAPLAKVLGLNTTVIFGGVSPGPRRSPRSTAASTSSSPARAASRTCSTRRLISLDDVQITVLDEADHMADLGFLPVVKRILDKTPPRGQRLLFSATLDKGVDQLVKRYLTNPVEHSVDSAESPVAAMTHHLFEVRDAEAKKAVVHHLASGTGRRVLFMRTKHQAKKLAKQLTMDGIPAVDLHGNLAQAARERNLEAFSVRRRARARRHRHRRPRHPRRRHRARRARRPAGRAQGVPAPLRPHRACRVGRRRRHGRPARAARRRPPADPCRQDHGHPEAGQRR